MQIIDESGYIFFEKISENGFCRFVFLDEVGSHLFGVSTAPITIPMTFSGVSVNQFVMSSVNRARFTMEVV